MSDLQPGRHGPGQRDAGATICGPAETSGSGSGEGDDSITAAASPNPICCCSVAIGICVCSRGNSTANVAARGNPRWISHSSWASNRSGRHGSAARGRGARKPKS